MWKKISAVGALVGIFGFALTACVTAAPTTGEDEDVGSAQQEIQQFCGGFAGFPCPAGYVCVDDPSDSCDPDQGGADCGGVCRKAKKPTKNECKDPAREYISTDPAVCATIKFFCAEGVPFSDKCGCGCEVGAGGGEPCGSNVCGAGEYCCNASCGICAPEGGVCIQIACDTQTL